MVWLAMVTGNCQLYLLPKLRGEARGRSMWSCRVFRTPKPPHLCLQSSTRNPFKFDNIHNTFGAGLRSLQHARWNCVANSSSDLGLPVILTQIYFLTLHNKQEDQTLLIKQLSDTGACNSAYVINPFPRRNIHSWIFLLSREDEKGGGGGGQGKDCIGLSSYNILILSRHIFIIL